MIAVFIVVVERTSFEKREHGFDGVSFESDLLSFDKMVNAFQFCV